MEYNPPAYSSVNTPNSIRQLPSVQNILARRVIGADDKDLRSWDPAKASLGIRSTVFSPYTCGTCSLHECSKNHTAA
jgi:hypothetical protein